MKKDEKIHISERALSLLMKARKRGASNYAIAKATGITERTISNYVNGNTMPTLANANILIAYFEGSMLKSELGTVEEPLAPYSGKEVAQTEVNNLERIIAAQEKTITLLEAENRRLKDELRELKNKSTEGSRERLAG